MKICDHFDFVSNLAFSYGLLCLAIAYAVHLMNSSVLQVSTTECKSQLDLISKAIKVSAEITKSKPN